MVSLQGAHFKVVLLAVAPELCAGRLQEPAFKVPLPVWAQAGTVPGTHPRLENLTLQYRHALLTSSCAAVRPRFHLNTGRLYSPLQPARADIASRCHC